MGELHNTYINSACNYIVHALNALGELMDRRHTILNRMLIIMASIFALVALMGAASATDYYVATWGDNTTQGDITHPWQNVSYATQQAVAGDTIYLFNGTWYNEHAVFANSGNATHPITLTSYNGTPILDGVDKAGYGVEITSYIDISDLEIVRYYTTIHPLGVGSSYINITNCTLGDTGGSVVVMRGDHTWLRGCTLYEGGWNTLQLIGHATNKSRTSYVYILDNYFYNCSGHTGGADIMDNTSHVDIIGNTINDSNSLVYVHSSPYTCNNLNVSDNILHNITGHAMDFMWTKDAVATNNTIHYASGNGVYAYIGHFPSVARNLTVKNNRVYDAGGYQYRLSVRTESGIGRGSLLLVDNNNGIDSTQYVIEGNTTYGLLRFTEYTKPFKIFTPYTGKATAEFTDGRVFTHSIGSYTPYILTLPCYYPDKSNITLENLAAASDTITITTYNITLRPTHGHLYDVTVDAWDEASGTYRITASSTVSDNPTWVNLTTKAASATYDITRDGKSYTPATADADGVLRYRFTDEWDGPQTFEVSYASDEAGPEPNVTSLQNEPPTQRTIDLYWDCSAPGIDHYTIYQNGALLNTTESQYYRVTDLLSDTTYTFGVSATTTAGITGDIVSITVRTAAEESFGSNTLHIPTDITASKGSYVTVPVMIYDATGVACSGVNLTYDASVVNVIGVTQGDFTTYFGFDDESAADGWVLINTYVNETSLTGDVKIADLILKAVGDAGDTSPLDMEIIAMADQNGRPVSGTVSNGLFTVVSDTSPPIVTDPSASQLIPDDTDGVPSWGETATLNVTVTDESDIAGVTIDLSAIGGSPVQPMTHIAGNVWSVTTSASAGTPPRTYELQVCATDIYGYTNMSESVELVVMRNGDVTGDGDVRSDDVTLLENYVTYSGQHTVSSEFVADVTGDGVVDIADAMLLANHVTYPDQYTRR